MMSDSNGTSSMTNSSMTNYFDAFQTEEELKLAENCRVLEFLTEKCGDITKLISLFKSETDTTNLFDIKRFESKKIIVKGFVQSGKTNFIITASSFFRIFGSKNIIIITRNCTDDERQLKCRIAHFNQEMEKHNIEVDESNYFIEIGNSSRLKSLSKKVKDYVLFVDEVDFMDSVDTKTTLQLEKLKRKSYCYFGISATIMDPILKIEDTELIILSKPENYRGIESFIVDTIPNKNTILTRKSSNPIIEDANLEDYLVGFSNRQVYRVPIYNEYHPVDTLIRVSVALDPNRRLLSYLATQFPSMVSMFYSGGGSIELYIPNIITPIELYDGNTSIVKELKTEVNNEVLQGVYHHFSNASPAHIKQWLYENGGVSLYPRIITLAGQLASRCISYGASNFEQCKRENKLWWHLTEMYLCASAGMDQPELIQTAGRLCVATPRGDNVPLTLYVSEKVKKDLIRAYWLQEELIERAQERHKVCNSPLWALIQCTQIYKRKIPSKRRSLTKKVEYDLLETKEKDDGGYDLKNYDFTTSIEDETKEKKAEDVVEVDYEVTKNKIKNTLKKGTTAISIFLNQISLEASYTKEELLHLLETSGYKQPMSYFTSLTKPSNKKFGVGCIFENVEGNRWKVIGCLTDAWLK